MGRTDSFASGYAPADVTRFDPLIDDFVPKKREYTHFDLRLSEVDRENFSTSLDVIAKHSFWPLLGFEKKERRVKKSDDGELEFKVKTRGIKFGSHGDAAIMGWFAQSLSQKYEKALIEKGVTKNVLAYRQGLGSNIDQASELFQEIETRGPCVAIAMDVKGFFDNLDHDILLDSLKAVESVDRLGAAEFKIYKRMTNFEWVDSKRLKLRLGKLHGRSGRICTAKEFRDVVRGQEPSLINTNPDNFGVPQGTPLSGLFANIYMLDFDRLMVDHTKSLGGSYRRYSDDIAIILPAEADILHLSEFVESEIQKLNLKFNPTKTEISKFKKINGKLESDSPFQYLGFTFDGQRTLIRASSLKRYYSKMRKGIYGKIKAAFKQKIDRNEIYMRHLFKKYTHYGKNRNFPRYAYHASEIMCAPEIKAQLRNHMKIFRDTVDSALTEIYEQP